MVGSSDADDWFSPLSNIIESVWIVLGALVLLGAVLIMCAWGCVRRMQRRRIEMQVRSVWDVGGEVCVTLVCMSDICCGGDVG